MNLRGPVQGLVRRQPPEGDGHPSRSRSRDAAIALKRRRLTLTIALPMQSLDRLAIHKHVKNIGNA